MATDPQRENGHTEGIGGMNCRLSQAEEVVKTDPEIFRIAGEVAGHHLARKSVVSGRHRRVSRKNVGRGYDLEGGIIFQPFVLDVLADPFQGQKRGVTLVHVIDFRRDAERIERPDSADPKNDLLADDEQAVFATQQSPSVGSGCASAVSPRRSIGPIVPIGTVTKRHFGHTQVTIIPDCGYTFQLCFQMSAKRPIMNTPYPQIIELFPWRYKNGRMSARSVRFAVDREFISYGVT